jgi:hypothetical protein
MREKKFNFSLDKIKKSFTIKIPTKKSSFNHLPLTNLIKIVKGGKKIKNKE